MCKCCKCNNERTVDFTVIQWDCKNKYNGGTPFSIVAVLDKDYNILTPKQCTESGRGAFNGLGYVQNYFMRELVDFDKMYIERAETLPVLSSTFVLLLVYNDTN